MTSDELLEYADLVDDVADRDRAERLAAAEGARRLADLLDASGATTLGDLFSGDADTEEDQ